MNYETRMRNRTAATRATTRESCAAIGAEADSDIARLQADAEMLRELLRECRLALIFAPAHDPALMARILDALGDST